MEELQTKSQTSDMETRPSYSAVHENIRTKLQKTGSRCFGLMNDFKYWTVAEVSLFAKGQRQCHLEGCDWEERPPRSEPEWCFVTGLLC